MDLKCKFFLGFYSKGKPSLLIALSSKDGLMIRFTLVARWLSIAHNLALDLSSLDDWWNSNIAHLDLRRRIIQQGGQIVMYIL